MIKCLNIGKNIGQPIYRSISSHESHGGASEGIKGGVTTVEDERGPGLDFSLFMWWCWSKRRTGGTEGSLRAPGSRRGGCRPRGSGGVDAIRQRPESAAIRHVWGGAGNGGLTRLCHSSSFRLLFSRLVYPYTQVHRGRPDGPPRRAQSQDYPRPARGDGGM